MQLGVPHGMRAHDGVPHGMRAHDGVLDLSPRLAGLATRHTGDTLAPLEREVHPPLATGMSTTADRPVQRVTHVVATLEIGGAERFAVDLAIAQRRAGIDAHLVAMYGGGPLRDVARVADVPCATIERSVRWDPVAWSRLVALLRAMRPDVLHLHDASPILLGVPAARAAGCRTVVGVRHHVRPIGALREVLLRRCERRLSVCVASSRAVARFLASMGRAADLPVVHCGIDVTRFRFREPRTEVAPRILSVGRLDEQKGHLVLIEALAILRRTHPAARLVLAGEGPLRAAIVARARALGVLDAVDLAGIVTDTRALLEQSDLFCFPSLWEPQGLALLEAQAAGVPVVASALDGILETVQDGETGVLVPAGDPAALARALGALASDRIRRAALARRARDASARWDVGVAAARYDALYRAARAAGAA